MRGKGGHHTTIKQWPEGERPREKLAKHGAVVLSEAELIAILLRTGSRGATAVDLARKLLSRSRSLRGLARLSLSDLVEMGIGHVRAATLVAALELARRLPSSDGERRPAFRSPAEVAERYLPKFRDLKHEEFWALLLDSANRLMSEVKVTSGTLNSSLVHPRECFNEALKQKAASVIFLHNHPSGNPEPSQEDIAITRQLADAGKILGIPVHDHLVLGSASYTSFAERGLI